RFSRDWSSRVLFRSLETLEQNKYNPVFYYDIRESLEVPVHVEFGAPVAGFGNGTASSRNKQFGIYIQDDWEVNEHLTLNLGVRWDYEETPGDRKSTRLNSSHVKISYAVFCL